MADRRGLQRTGCSEPGCHTAHWARGLCKVHYGRRSRAGTLPPLSVHSLSGIDLAARMADCSICGPGAKIRSRGPGRTPQCASTAGMCSEAAKRRQRTRHRVKRYGLTVEQYDEMVAAQRGRCLICEKPPHDGTQLAVDHDHATGRVRGLLCRPCNLAIGTLRDDPDAALRASMYLLQK